MRILFFNWKDIGHPEAGGAEKVTHELCKGLIKKGHKVGFITRDYEGAKNKIDGIKFYRVGGSKFTHFIKANKYYRNTLRGKYDIIIEEVNTVPYFISFVKNKEKHLYFYHQIAGIVWNYETKFPVSLIGRYLLEPVATWISSRSKSKVITISDSTKNDLIKYGFNQNKIEIIPQVIDIEPWQNFDMSIKEDKFTILFLSALRPMKRPLDAIKAYHIFLKENNYPDSQMWVAGGGELLDSLREYVEVNNLSNFVDIKGRVSEEEKIDLLRKASVLVSTSIKEGWGLIISEAHSQGTPTIAYDVDGLRDSSKQGGCKITKDSPHNLADAILKLYCSRGNIDHLDLVNSVQNMKFINTLNKFEKIVCQ